MQLTKPTGCFFNNCCFWFVSFQWNLPFYSFDFLCCGIYLVSNIERLECTKKKWHRFLTEIILDSWTSFLSLTFFGMTVGGISHWWIHLHGDAQHLAVLVLCLSCLVNFRKPFLLVRVWVSFFSLLSSCCVVLPCNGKGYGCTMWQEMIEELCVESDYKRMRK